jgi:hypothetical protein
LVPDFYYPVQPDLSYPTCELTKGFRLPASVGSSQLVDFAFLSAMAYEEPNVTKPLLDAWFGPGRVVDETDFVARYRVETNTQVIPVYYKLFSFPSLPGVGVVSIRGSQTSWDWMVNLQLWASSGLAQVVQAFVPFGWIWTPVLDDLVSVVNSVESKSLNDVSYYKTVGQFCLDLLAGYDGGDGQQYESLRLTGVSLGGGIANIVGGKLIQLIRAYGMQECSKEANSFSFYVYTKRKQESTPSLFRAPVPFWLNELLMSRLTSSTPTSLLLSLTGTLLFGLVVALDCFRRLTVELPPMIWVDVTLCTGLFASCLTNAEPEVVQ